MKKQKRIIIAHGTATVDINCSKETIMALNRLAEKAYHMPLLIPEQPVIMMESFVEPDALKKTKR